MNRAFCRLHQTRLGYDAGGMERLIRRLAELSQSTPGKAADNLDKVVHRIVQQLRDGQPADVPGLGKFEPGPSPRFHPENQNGYRRK